MREALLAGLLGGLAIFIKLTAAFFVIGGALGLALTRFTLRDLLRNRQVWGMALLGVIPASAYLVYGIFIDGRLGGQFSGRFIPALLLSPLNYLAWETKVSYAAGGLFIMLGLIGLVMAEDRRIRNFLLGLWGAYLLYGLFFDYHVATHDYYHLPFIPIVAVSLAPLGGWFLARLTEAAVQPWMRSAVFLILLYGLLSNVWDVIGQMKSVDYRPQAAMWEEISGQLGAEARVIALTQDYGSRLEYWGWMTAVTWPYVGDLNYANARGGGFSFDRMFKRFSEKKDYFLVTDFDEFERQSELKERLTTSYPLHAQGNGYLIFDLKNPGAEARNP